jgi:hypothetical protein
MSDDKMMICHRMSGIMREGLGGRLVEVKCKEEDCALWDPLLECCADFSVILQERTNIRAVVSDLIANMADEMTKQVDERDRLKDGDGGVTGVAYGKCEGRIEILQKTIMGLRKRFNI